MPTDRKPRLHQTHIRFPATRLYNRLNRLPTPPHHPFVACAVRMDTMRIIAHGTPHRNLSGTQPRQYQIHPSTRLLPSHTQSTRLSLLRFPPIQSTRLPLLLFPPTRSTRPHHYPYLLTLSILVHHTLHIRRWAYRPAQRLGNR